jgi:putative endonuclease
MRHQNYFVYILTNHRHTVLYIGVTNDLGRRLWEHGVSCRSHFARQYNADKLIHFEAFPDPGSAIAARETIEALATKQKGGANREIKSRMAGLGLRDVRC